MLRDSKHSREDPLETIPDIRYFYEPLHSLEKSEQKFMIDLIREVLKMMVSGPQMMLLMFFFGFGQKEQLRFLNLGGLGGFLKT